MTAAPKHPIAADLLIDGMTCAACVRRVEKAIANVPGVTSAAVNLATEKATVAFDGAPDLAAVVAAIEKAGYAAKPALPDVPPDADRAARTEEIAAFRRDLTIAALLSAPVIVLEMGGHLIPALHHWTMATLGNWGLYLQFVLTALVLAGPGRRFFAKGIPALLQGQPDMNALVALGSGAAFLYSTVATFLPALLPDGSAQVYFEAAAVIVVLILTGRYLEARAKGRTGEAIRKLIALQPETARLMRDGVAVEVPLAALKPGDLVQVRPGERVAVDGRVTEGTSYVNEAMVTGEPIPAAKSIGSPVIGGTINTTGSFTFRAERVGADTLIARIVALVESAQGAKLPIQAVVDGITAWFVPAVLAVAAATFGLWLWLAPAPALGPALVAAVAVLIIACPCAMGLATPVSIMVATGRAAELGVLFRKGDALQTLRDATIIALDKTGTLTAGQPELTDLIAAPGMDEAEMLRLVASVEARSEHPVARAIVTAAEARGLKLAEASHFTSIPGRGVSAAVEGRIVEIGTAPWLSQSGRDVSAFADSAARLAASGRTPLHVAIDGSAAAILAVADPVKPTTPAAIRALQALGLRVVMISGDNRLTAEAIGRDLGIDEVVAEVLPEGKVAVVERLKAGGTHVAFVGDGVNDAPALAAADTGIAIGTGTDIAIESADVVLMSGDLAGVVTAIALSRATLRNIRQNLFWAFAYNAALVPVAAGALYPIWGIQLSPMLGAGAMALSSVFVVTNALRLKRFRPGRLG